MWFLVVAAICVAACAGAAPDVPSGSDGEPDAVLTQGREVWVNSCASCHASDGGGGSGPKVADGEALKSFSDPADQAKLILEGEGSMPGFADELSDSEVDAVVRYTREVLN